MRKSLSLTIFILLLALLFPQISRSQPVSSSIRIGKIVAQEGLVIVRRKTRAITVDQSGTSLYREDEVLTNEKGKAKMLLSGGNEIFVAPNSNLLLTKHLLDRYQYGYDLSLKGKIRAKIQRVPKRRFRLKTASALIEVKGTDFIVDADEEGKTALATIDGLVSVTSLETEETVDVPVGEQVSVSDEGEVEEPVEIQTEMVIDLEYGGKTGFEELDEVIEEQMEAKVEAEPEPASPPEPDIIPEPEPEPVIIPEPEQIIIPEPEPYNPEETRETENIGIGFSGETGLFGGPAIVMEYNIGDRYQLHFQHMHKNGLNEDSLFPIYRTSTAVMLRFFMDNAGAYAGIGIGHNNYIQFPTGYPSVSDVNGFKDFAVLDFGNQVYFDSNDLALSFNISTQIRLPMNYNSDAYAKLSTVDADDFLRYISRDMISFVFSLIVYF